MQASSSNIIHQFSKGVVTLEADDIFCVLYNPDTLLELEDFKDVRSVYEEWNSKRPLKLLVEFQALTTASNEARSLAEKNPIDAVAEAIVFTGLAQRLFVRFYLMVQKQEHPVKIFKNKAKAMDWLISI